MKHVIAGLFFSVTQWTSVINREFKKLLRLRQGLRRLKSEFIFHQLISGYSKSFTLFITVKPITKQNLGHCDKFELEI